MTQSTSENTVADETPFLFGEDDVSEEPSRPPPTREQLEAFAAGGPDPDAEQPPAGENTRAEDDGRPSEEPAVEFPEKAAAAAVRLVDQASKVVDEFLNAAGVPAAKAAAAKLVAEAEDLERHGPSTTATAYRRMAALFVGIARSYEDEQLGAEPGEASHEHEESEELEDPVGITELEEETAPSGAEGKV